MFLALDTSTQSLSLALGKRSPTGFERVEEIVLGAPHKQSELLPSSVGELLARHGIRPAELQGIAVGLGPGSFTGLRIGLSSAKALSYAARVPLVGASSLAAAALTGPEGVPLYVIAVARTDDLYLGRYIREGEGLRSLSPEEAYSPTELAELLAQEKGAQVMGPAVADYQEKLVVLGVERNRFLSVGQIPSAAALLSLASFPVAFDVQAVFALEPHYIRTSGAERNPKFPPLPGDAPKARLKED